MQVSLLHLEWRQRPVSGGRTPRSFLEFIIDGRPLLVHLGSSDADFISRLGWGTLEAHRRGVEQLLLKAPPDAPSGGVLLLICPQCGHLDCGAFTARIEKTEHYFVWSGFAFENNSKETPIERFPK